MIKTAFQSLFHLFLPHNCAGCGSDLLSANQQLCLRCINRLPVTGFHLHAGNPVEKIFMGRLPVTSAATHLYFTKDSLPQELLHQLKYKGNRQLGVYFGKRIGREMQQSGRFSTIDALVPVPLFAARERKRGYNQAGILCEGIAEVLDLPVLKNIIARNEATETQTKKNRIERWQNIEGKFELLDPGAASNRHILLVDDVITTGATLEACGQELLTIPGIRISIFTLAWTLK